MSGRAIAALFDVEPDNARATGLSERTAILRR
jgi:hypothetical protein